MRTCVGKLVQRELANRADEKVLRWFGHVEKMNEYRMPRRGLLTDLSGGRVWWVRCVIMRKI